MLKRLVLAIAIVAVVAIGVLAQDMPNSISDEISAGLFRNEIDAALTVNESGSGPTLRTLGVPYLLAGLANLNGTANTSTTAFGPLNPLWMALAIPGEVPWSALLGTGATGFTPAAADVTTTTATTTVGLDNYDYVDNQQTITNTSLPFREMNAVAQVLFALAQLNVGLYVQYFFDENAAYITASGSEENVTITEVVSFDNGGGAAPPVVETAYTRSAANTQRNRTTNIIAMVPFYLAAGEMQHWGALTVDHRVVDNTRSDTTSYTDANTAYTTVVAPTVVPTEDTQNDLVRTTNILLDYVLSLPPLLGGGGNLFRVGGQAGVILRGADTNAAVQNGTFEYDGAGTTTNNLTDTDTTTRTVESGLYIDPTINVSHLFEYKPDPQVDVSFEPGLAFTVDWGELYPSVTGDTQTVNTDGDADGLFDSAADSVDTTTTTYTNAGWSGGAVVAQAEEFVIDTTFSLPMAIKVKPENWPFGITASATPSIQYTRTQTTTLGNTTTATTVFADGLGTTASTDVSTTSTPETVATTSGWNITATQAFGLNFEFPGGVKADVKLNLANFLAFDSLTAQVIAPLVGRVREE